VLGAEAPTISPASLDKGRHRLAETVAGGPPDAKKALLRPWSMKSGWTPQGGAGFFRVPIGPVIADAPDQQGKV